MAEEKVGDCLNLVLSINKIIESLGNVVNSLQEGDDDGASQYLDQAATQVKKLSSQIESAEEGPVLTLDERSTRRITKNLTSVHQLISEVKESWPR